MASGIHQLGDYTIEDDGTDLLIKDPQGNTVFKWDENNGKWSFESNPLDSIPSINGGITSSKINNLVGGGLSVSSNNLTADIAVNRVDTNTTTSGSGLYLVDTSGGAKTLTLASSDATNEESIGVINISGSNAVTVDTESTETIDPNGDSSKTQNKEGWLLWYNGTGTNWDSTLAAEFESVDTESATINETYVRVHLSSNFSFTTANGWGTLPLDSEDKDNLNEFDTSNNQFSPNETGEYEIGFQVNFGVASDGDSVLARVQNVTDGTAVIQTDTQAGGTDGEAVGGAKKVTLDSAKNYKLQCRNLDNDDTIFNTNSQTYLTIERVYR